MNQIEQLNTILNQLERRSLRSLRARCLQSYLNSTPLVYWSKYCRPQSSSRYPFIFSNKLLGPVESNKSIDVYSWLSTATTKLEWSADLEAQQGKATATDLREASVWMYRLLDLLVWEILYPQYFKPIPARRAVQVVRFNAQSIEVHSSSTDQELLTGIYHQLRDNKLINTAFQLLDSQLGVEQRYVRAQLEKAKIKHPLTPRPLGVHVKKSRPRGPIYMPAANR